jgi:hypothetical protein
MTEIKRTIMNTTNSEMVCDLNIGDTVGYRLHNSSELIKSAPAKVVGKTDKVVTLDDGLRLTPRKGYWVLKMKDRHGAYHTTYYKI